MPLDNYLNNGHEENDESTYINEIYCYPLSIKNSSDSESDKCPDEVKKRHHTVCRADNFKKAELIENTGRLSIEHFSIHIIDHRIFEFFAYSKLSNVMLFKLRYN